MAGMTLYTMFDASVPPSSAYPGSAAVAGYLGGNTPHVWTPEEWRRFATLRQFPIWVGYLEADPAGHAADAAAAMQSLGWTPGHNDPASTRACILDFETEIDAAWVDAFANRIYTAGYVTIVYGSESTIIDNPARDGRWIALYNGEANIPDDPEAIGHQYRADVPWGNTQVDLSVITDTMLAHAGYGPRHG